MEWLVGIVIFIAIQGEFELRAQRKKQKSELQRLEATIGDSVSSTSGDATKSQIDEASAAPQSESQRSRVAIGVSAGSNSADTIRSQIDDTKGALSLSRIFAVVSVPLSFLLWYIAYEHQSTGHGWEIMSSIMFTVVAGLLMVWFFIACVLVALGTGGLRTSDHGAFANLESRRDPDERKRRSRRMLWVGLAGNAIGLAGLAWLYLSL